MNLGSYFALLFVILSCLLNNTNSEYRIIGGAYWNIRSSPYLVSIHYEKKYLGVGTIVTEKIVITAANCVVNLRNWDLFYIAAGVSELDFIRRLGQVRYVEDVVIPPNYDLVTQHMNIAVMKIRKWFDLCDTVQKISISHCSFETCTRIRVSGWGWTTPQDGTTSNTLQSTVLSSLLLNDCVKHYLSASTSFTSTMICAGHSKSDMCVGDFGAPGIVDGRFCAVASHNLGCMNPHYPSVFTNLNNAAVIDFLSKEGVLA